MQLLMGQVRKTRHAHVPMIHHYLAMIVFVTRAIIGLEPQTILVAYNAQTTVHRLTVHVNVTRDIMVMQVGRVVLVHNVPLDTHLTLAATPKGAIAIWILILNSVMQMGIV